MPKEKNDNAPIDKNCNEIYKDNVDVNSLATSQIHFGNIWKKHGRQMTKGTGNQRETAGKDHLEVGKMLQFATDKELEVFVNGPYMAVLRDRFLASKRDATPRSDNSKKSKRETAQASQK